MSNDNRADPFDPEVWSQKDFTERVRTGTQSYLVGGMGYGVREYGFHAVKLAPLCAWLDLLLSFHTRTRDVR